MESIVEGLELFDDSARPLHFINHINLLFENGKIDCWLIEMEELGGSEPNKTNEIYWICLDGLALQALMGCGVVCCFSLWWVMGGGTANGSAKRREREEKELIDSWKEKELVCEWSEFGGGVSGSQSFMIEGADQPKGTKWRAKR